MPIRSRLIHPFPPCQRCNPLRRLRCGASLWKLASHDPQQDFHPMRICVFGAGAVGSHFALRLALAGHDVSCVMRGAHLDAVKANGLTLRVGDGEFKAKVRTSSDPAALGRQDAVICTLKATGLSTLADGLQPLLGEDTAVV